MKKIEDFTYLRSVLGDKKLYDEIGYPKTTQKSARVGRKRLWFEVI